MEGLAHCKRSLDKLLADITPGNKGKADKLLSAVAAGCRDEADRLYYASGVRDADTVKVPAPKIEGDTAVVSAISPSILFVEFGTGINLNTESSSMIAGQYGFFAASWSIGHSQWLVPPRSMQFGGYWPLPNSAGGGWDEGHAPVDAMYHSFNTMLRNLPNTVKGVFK